MDAREGLSLQGVQPRIAAGWPYSWRRVAAWVLGDGGVCCCRGGTWRCDKHDEAAIPPKCSTRSRLQREAHRADLVTPVTCEEQATQQNHSASGSGFREVDPQGWVRSEVL